MTPIPVMISQSSQSVSGRHNSSSSSSSSFLSRRQQKVRRKRQQRRRLPKATTAMAFQYLPLLMMIIMKMIVVVGILLLLLSVMKGMVVVVNAKEMTVTHEWQPVGENDTIPAGMHVRMDLSTGGKWVKLPAEDDDDSNDGNDGISASASSASSASSSSSVSMAVVDQDGTVHVVEKERDDDNDDDASSLSSSSSYDFEMMHRTLSKLPKEEQERMGGLPELLSLSSSAKDDENAAKSTEKKTSYTKEQRAMFERRMLEIWQRRQEELESVMQDQLIDFPSLLKDRIRSLQEYLHDPAASRRRLGDHPHNGSTIRNASEKENDDDDDDGDGDKEENEGDAWTMDIRSVLEDLEYQLTDLDMTRDFHTMGGWPLLVALVSEQSHYSVKLSSNDSSTNSDMITSFDWSKIRSLQALAAWGVGTAVKNAAEFHSFATESISIGTNHPTDNTTFDSTTFTTTPIDLLIDVFCNTYKLYNDDDDDHSQINTKEVHQLLAKSMYAIGSLLRGNRVAQSHVATTADDDDDDGTTGLERLGQTYLAMATSLKTFSSSSSSSDMKLMGRMASLATDLVEDVALHPELADDTTNQSILNQVTSQDWCTATCQAITMSVQNNADRLLPVRIQETVLKSVAVLAPHCNFNDNNDEDGKCNIKDFEDALHNVQAKWDQNENDYDEEHLDQLKMLMKDALIALQEPEVEEA